MRTCLEHLPNLLIVHLKRFELDYRTFETVKLNDRCSFPMLLDLKPYTMKGTDERRVLFFLLSYLVGGLSVFGQVHFLLYACGSLHALS